MKPVAKQKFRLRHYVLIGFITLLVAAGLSLIGNGLWIKAKAQLAQILLNQAFERTQLASTNSSARISSTAAKPWGWADIKTLARLNAPRLAKSAIILNNTSGEALAFGPGHLPNTPLPGEQGTSVLAAHRDTHFSWIKDLKTGDKIEVENADGSLAIFSVRRNWIAPYNASGIDAHTHETLLALTTCYPFDAITPGPMRYIIEAELVEKSLATSMLKPATSSP